MGARMFVSMNIAVIGNSGYSCELATSLAQLGHNVCVGVKEHDLALTKCLLAHADGVEVYNIEDAAADSDVIAISVPTEEVREYAYWLGDVRNTIIFDLTNAPELRSEENMNTCSAIKAITGSPHVVKGFRCTRYRELIKPLFKEQQVDSLVAGDSKKAKAMFALICRDLGFPHVVDFGDSTTIALLEEMVRCWHKLAVNTEDVQPVSVKK